ncbi:uncharacterized protein LAESUDRAFT_715295 [Laetiporus sulphureus 93-53]|uniref:Uncharacterized protein n=1 Tax=Laetiporus sulphureus 93-53 TaxID=1314785 RepID=A0A165DER3_9APHY|nr:uncharacterized protein LAESUDRAFT_715295 [Laetiporus sulphureus 93-53]KZT04725.1 hypothetical protein LAESUDRAFT_715295 [Laetiporus sulphureus 93-53]
MEQLTVIFLLSLPVKVKHVLKTQPRNDNRLKPQVFNGNVITYDACSFCIWLLSAGQKDRLELILVTWTFSLLYDIMPAGVGANEEVDEGEKWRQSENKQYKLHHYTPHTLIYLCLLDEGNNKVFFGLAFDNKCLELLNNLKIRGLILEIWN